MKKTLTYIILLLSALTFTGCDKEGVTETKSNSVITDTSCYENRFLNAVTSVAEADQGYYILGYDFGHYIMYASKKNNKMVYLCGKANCEHVDNMGCILSTCDAYMGNVIPASITCYNDKIYILKYDNHKVSLVEISKDGGEHRQVCELGKAPDMTAGLYQYSIYDNCAYVVSVPESISESEPAELFKVSLDTGEKEVIYQSTECKRYMLKRYGNYIFYLKMTLEENPEFSVCKYDFINKEEEIIATDKIWNYTINNRTNSVLYWVSEKGLMNYDLTTGKTTQLKEADDTNRYVWISCNGKYVFIDNKINQYYYDKKGAHSIEVLDIENASTVTKIVIEAEADMQLCGTDRLIADFFTETGLKQYYIPITAIEAGKELEWKMFEE